MRRMPLRSGRLGAGDQGVIAASKGIDMSVLNRSALWREVPEMLVPDEEATKHSGRRVERSIHHRRDVDEGRCIPVSAEENPTEDDPVLDAEGAAHLLHVSTKTLLKSARAGLIPGRKVGREWRFARTALLDYLARPVSA